MLCRGSTQPEQRSPRAARPRAPARPRPHLVREGGAAQRVPQQAQADVPAGALSDEVEVQRVPAGQPAVPQHGAQGRLPLGAQRRAPLRLGEHHEEVQVAAPRRRLAALGVAVCRGGRRGAEAAGGAGEGLPAAAQVVEGAHGQRRGQRQRARLGARPAPAQRRRHDRAGPAPPPAPGPPTQSRSARTKV